MKRFWHWLTFPSWLNADRLEAHARANRLEEICVDQRERLADAKKELERLTQLIAQVRVSQSTIGRAGWEVMAFIPEEALEYVRQRRPDHILLHKLIERVVWVLVKQALDGINRVDAMGRVSALVFGMPGQCADNRCVQALFDSAGKYKLSDHLHDTKQLSQSNPGSLGAWAAA